MQELCGADDTKPTVADAWFLLLPEPSSCLYGQVNTIDWLMIHHAFYHLLFQPSSQTFIGFYASFFSIQYSTVLNGNKKARYFYVVIPTMITCIRSLLSFCVGWNWVCHKPQSLPWYQVCLSSPSHWFDRPSWSKFIDVHIYAGYWYIWTSSLSGCEYYHLMWSLQHDALNLGCISSASSTCKVNFSKSNGMPPFWKPNWWKYIQHIACSSIVQTGLSKVMRGYILMAIPVSAVCNFRCQNMN